MNSLSLVLILGTLLSTTLTFAQEGFTTIKSQIVIDEPGVYDFKNEKIYWKGSGKCNQDEGQKACIIIKSDNVVLKNLTYKNCPDGLHILDSSNVLLDNVTGYACEDALTVKGSPKNIFIENSTFYPNPNKDERDKTLQIGTVQNLHLDNVKFIGGERCLRFKTGSLIYVKNSDFIDCTTAIKGDTDKYQGVKADRLSVISIKNTIFFGEKKTTRPFHLSGNIQLHEWNNYFGGARDSSRTSSGSRVYKNSYKHLPYLGNLEPAEECPLIKKSTGPGISKVPLSFASRKNKTFSVEKYFDLFHESCKQFRILSVRIRARVFSDNRDQVKGYLIADGKVVSEEKYFKRSKYVKPRRLDSNKLLVPGVTFQNLIFKIKNKNRRNVRFERLEVEWERL